MIKRQPERSLPQDLAAMRQNENSFAPLYGPLNQAGSNDCLAAAGRQYVQHLDGPIEPLGRLDLVIAQFAHAALRALAKAAAMVACTMSSPTASTSPDAQAAS
jgi:hypothetical protein